jgi:hypothetical protein
MDKKDFSLFRYRQANKYALYSLINNEFWVSCPDSFNDPYDSTFFVDIEEFKKHMLELKKRQNISSESSKSDEDFFNIIFEKIINNLKNSVWIACFSKKINNPVMWANYSQNGRGFAIEYSRSSLEKIAQISAKKYIEKYIDMYKPLVKNNTNYEYSNYVKNVNYANEKYDGTKMIMNILDKYSINKCNTPVYFDKKLVEDFNYFVFHTKKKIWEYENEWRMVLTTYGETAEEKANKHINIQNVENPIMPKAIYLGEFVEPFTKKVIYNYCYKNKIKLYKMYSDIFDNKFKLKCKKINKNSMVDIIEKQKNN